MEQCDRERGGDYLPSFFFKSRILYNIHDISISIQSQSNVQMMISFLVSHGEKNWVRFQLTDCVGRCRLIGIRRSRIWHRSLQLRKG